MCACLLLVQSTSCFHTNYSYHFIQLMPSVNITGNRCTVVIRAYVPVGIVENIAE